MGQLKKRGSIIKNKPKKVEYWNGGAGFRKWCEDFEVRCEVVKDGMKQWVPIPELSREPHHITGRTQWGMWEELCKVADEALRMENGVFVNRIIALCWMRGEAKSALACLIVCWLFFNFPAQQIMLSANTKDQSVFVHFNIISKTILNTPRLLEIVGSNNILDKKIRLMDHRNREVSVIQSISSYIGILSNITCFTFSEMFKMQDSKFFTELSGSIRNVPNALGIIDSTVAPLTHTLYKLYKMYLKGKNLIYFSYRCSLKGDHRDFWNPEMTADQLDLYRGGSGMFTDQEFDMYFKNTWSAAASKMISPQMIEAMHYIGVGKGVGGHHIIMQTLDKCELVRSEQGLPPEVKEERINKLTSNLIPTSKIYQLKTAYNLPRAATIDELIKLEDAYDTHWAICAGVDRADPLKSDLNRGARTIIAVLAKGLPGSRTNIHIDTTSSKATHYIYCLVHLYHVVMSDMNTIKKVLEQIDMEYGGINTFCTERAGMWDIEEWCEDLSIYGEIVAPSYSRQRDAFSEFYLAISEGRFKTPPTCVKGSKEDDIFSEELSIFEHDARKKVYYSPEKTLKAGIQDDAIYATAWAMYGGRMLTSGDFRIRTKSNFLSAFYNTQKLLGDY
jgi:hypothetical protein